LCPGLNVVIRSITLALWNDYNVKEIYGVRWGYRGFYEDFPKNWVPLDPKNVDGIQNLGGTILGSSRGGFNGPLIVKALVEKGIS
jgi:6-phosphofructokinase 1